MNNNFSNLNSTKILCATKKTYDLITGNNKLYFGEHKTTTLKQTIELLSMIASCKEILYSKK